MTLMRAIEEPTPLVFPFNGKRYTAPVINMRDGLRLNDIINGGTDPDLDVIELWKIALGPLWDELVADGVPLAFANRVGTTVLADFQYGRVYGEALWETGGDPTAMTEFMKARGNRAVEKPAESKAS